MTYEEDFKSVCGGLLCVFQFAFVGCAVAYIVFAITFLVKDYSVCGDASPLWIFVLVSLCSPTVLNCIRLQSQSPNSKDTDHVTPVASVLLMVSEVVTGGVLIYGENHVCENMKHTGLWIIALIIFWSILSVLTIMMVALLGFFFIGLVGSNEKPETNVVSTEHASKKKPETIVVRMDDASSNV